MQNQGASHTAVPTFSLWFVRAVAALGFFVFGVFSLANAQGQDRGLGERRVALVIGNAAYRTSPLKNPVNDARAVAAMLRRLNFEVIERENVTREAFAGAAREFGDRLKGASVGLFYFAGHGPQVRGRNFLVPVDADIAREGEVPYRSMDVNEILDKMDSARTPINLVLLDACRNNPFARSFKLSQVGLAQMDAPSGTLIAFATSPGSVAQDGEGDNGLYTGALLKHIATEALPIEQMLKRVRVDVVKASKSSQVPWESSSLNRDFALAEGRPTVSASVARPAPGAVASANTSELSLELAFWDAIKSSISPADYRAYLEQYPQGRFAALARVRAASGMLADRAPLSLAAAALTSPPPAAASPGARQLTSRAPAVHGSGRRLQGFSDGTLELLAGAGDRSSPLMLMLPSRAVVQALGYSPEGLYLAAVSKGHVFFVDAVQLVVLKTVDLPGAAGFVAGSVAFSPDGRWLAVGGQRAGQPVQTIFAVSSGLLLWDKPGTSMAFDRAQAVVTLRQADGANDRFELR